VNKLVTISILLFTMLSTTYAQQQLPSALSPEGDLVHYSFAALFGTGIYSLGDRTVAVLGIPISWTLREPKHDQYGIKLIVPTAVGFYDFNLFDDRVPTHDHFATLSVVPGIELEFLVGDNWRVAPAVHLGAGADLSTSERSIIYGASVSALRPLTGSAPDMQFGTEFLIGGYESNKSRGDFLSRLSAGIDAKFPVNWRFGERDVFLGGQVIGYYYMNGVDFQTIVGEPIRLRAELELGVFISARPAPTIFGTTLDRLGVGYRFSEVSDALVFFAGFPF